MEFGPEKHIFDIYGLFFKPLEDTQLYWLCTSPKSLSKWRYLNNKKIYPKHHSVFRLLFNLRYWSLRPRGRSNNVFSFRRLNPAMSCQIYLPVLHKHEDLLRATKTMLYANARKTLDVVVCRRRQPGSAQSRKFICDLRRWRSPANDMDGELIGRAKGICWSSGDSKNILA